VRDRHAAARDAVNDRAGAAQVGQLGPEQAAGLAAVGEAG
jgi:hypothetical protein